MCIMDGINKELSQFLDLRIDFLFKYTFFDHLIATANFYDFYGKVFYTFQVRLNPKPWLERWERMDLKGVEGLEEMLNDKQKRKREFPQNKRLWEKHDLMLKYRKTINPVESSQIYSEFLNRMKEKRQQKRKA